MTYAKKQAYIAILKQGSKRLIPYLENIAKAPMTDKELEKLMNRSHQTVSARLSELHDRGMIKIIGMRNGSSIWDIVHDDSLRQWIAKKRIEYKMMRDLKRIEREYKAYLPVELRVHIDRFLHT